MGWATQLKRKVSTHPNRSVPDVQAKRSEWKTQNWNDKLPGLVFLDESSVNIDMTRCYGRSIGQKRVVDHVPLGTPCHLTILSSVRWDGNTAFTTYSGGTSGETFVKYLKETLIPTLHSGDIVVMDNMRSHHVKGVEKCFAMQEWGYCIFRLTVLI